MQLLEIGCEDMCGYSGELMWKW